MTLHVFNPEHDMALASGLSNYTPAHAGRQLRHDLGFLPALWAEAGDAVLVDDREQALRAVRRRRVQPVLFVEKRDVGRLDLDRVEPWGWDHALCAALRRYGVQDSLLPSDEQLLAIRNLSHRREAAALLRELRLEGTTGEAVECDTVERTQAAAAAYGCAVLKAPWSSSGRGIRFVTDVGEREKNWVRNTIAKQGSVMVEPLYHRVKDFAVEFVSDGRGGARCLGLSLFHTQNGAYTGNVLAAEPVKREMLGNYIPLGLLDRVTALLCERLGQACKGIYSGPLGVDMMIVRGRKSLTAEDPQASTAAPTSAAPLLLHPCVEINLRRTMGHVALALSPADGDERRAMCIDYNCDHYKLKTYRL